MSSETKWTKHEWSVRDDDGDLDVIAITPDGTVFVIAENIGGMVYKDSAGKYTDRSEVFANAHVLRASPKLYEALAEFVPETQSGKLTEAERIEKARTALASARGEG